MLKTTKFVPPSAVPKQTQPGTARPRDGWELRELERDKLNEQDLPRSAKEGSLASLLAERAEASPKLKQDLKRKGQLSKGNPALATLHKNIKVIAHVHEALFGPGSWDRS